MKFKEVVEGSKKERFLVKDGRTGRWRRATHSEVDNIESLDRRSDLEKERLKKVGDKNYLASLIFGTNESKKEKLSNSEKFKKVMKEFSAGTLHSGSGEVVKDVKQALAIAYNEAEKMNESAEVGHRIFKAGQVYKISPTPSSVETKIQGYSIVNTNEMFLLLSKEKRPLWFDSEKKADEFLKNHKDRKWLIVVRVGLSSMPLAYNGYMPKIAFI